VTWVQEQLASIKPEVVDFAKAKGLLLLPLCRYIVLFQSDFGLALRVILVRERERKDTKLLIFFKQNF
jgi:hypothetical protein